MAERRMIARKIVDSDLFLGMPITTQNLYFHLSMRADDDGFINNVKSIMAMVRANDDDLRVLIQRQYVIPFETGIIVITHWRVNNYLRNDRYIETQHLEEKAQLVIANSRPYRLKAKQTPKGQLTQPQLETDTKPVAPHQTPTLDEITAYCQARNSPINPQIFYDFYNKRQWHIGKNILTDWQGKIAEWEQNQNKHTKPAEIIDYGQDC